MFSQQFLKEHFFSKAVIGGLAAIVLLSLVYLNYQRSVSQQSNPLSTQPLATLTSAPQLGEMSLGLDDQSKKTVGQLVSVTVTASSAGRLITGYDLALQYDPSAFQFSKITPLIPGYTSFPFITNEHLAVTGVKTPQGTSISFNQVPLVRLTFTAKKVGTYSLTLMPTIAKDKTQLIDTTSAVLRPHLGGVSIAIY